MVGRCAVLGMLGGAGMVHGLPRIPSWFPALGEVALAGLLLWLVLVGYRCLRHRSDVLFGLAVDTSIGIASAAGAHTVGKHKVGYGAGVMAVQVCLALLLGLVCGAGYTGWRAELRLADVLEARHENLVTRLTVQITSLPAGNERYQTFEARVLERPVSGIPERLRVVWPVLPEAVLPDLVPGDIYSAALMLRRPHGLANPRAFDAEAWMFERGLRARATVRGEPQFLMRPFWAGWGVAVERWRHSWRAALRESLEGTRYGAVIIALALGDQASVDAADWAIFSRTGIIHLVSISGMHVTLFAGLAGGAVLWAWKRLSWRGLALAERLPAQVAGAVAALVVAWLYCLLAGWGVPAQRTFFMLATVGIAAILRLPITPSRLLPVAALAVVLLDPWAMLAPGFWLSFGAVAVLMLMGTGRWARGAQSSWRHKLRLAAEVQGVMSVALVPLLALQFHEVSLVSPLANAIAIPIVTFIVTPLALMAMVLAPWPLLGLVGDWLALAAEWVFRGMMWPVAWMGSANWATWPVAAPPWALVLLGVAGVVYAVLPAGLPARAWGWLLMLPLLWWQPSRLAPGEWRLQVLDVGQGSAAVLQTRHHVLVVDIGPPLGDAGDAGDRVVWPYLRAQGLRGVDELLISHADVDHAGGLPGLLQHIGVRRWRSPEPMELPELGLALQDMAWAPCRKGQGWQWDGVIFRVLYPAEEDLQALRGRNDGSCVLLVQGWWHGALLPGDIEAGAERRMLGDSQAGQLAVEVVLMPHHGSLTSSTPAWVAAIRAGHAVAQAAYLSRFGHPRPEVVARWRATGARTYDTARDGALEFTSGREGLLVRAQRWDGRRYWHHPGD